MAWLKSSDKAHSSRMVLAPLAWRREPEWPADGGHLALMIFGLVMMCAVYSAEHNTDYVIEDGTIAGLARTPDWRLLAELAERAGYWQRLETDDGYLLVDDSEAFVHIRLKAEQEWERQRKRDTDNDKLTVPVRLRDGDGCRHCGEIVDWSARTGKRAGTYDHRVPGKGAEGPHDLCVACNSCNATRKNAKDWILRPVPDEPFYGKETVKFLTDRGRPVPQSGTARPRTQRGTAPSTTARPVTSADPAPGDLAPGQTTPTPATPAMPEHRASTTTATPARPEHRAPRPVLQTDPARSSNGDQPKPAPTGKTGTHPPEPGRPGSGTGRVGSGAPDHPPGDPSTQNQARSLPKPRRRRGRRSKPTKGATP